MTERTRCMYPYKTCQNLRALKADGEIHKLCNYHRNRANSVQRVYATKRRERYREQRRVNGIIGRRKRRKAVQPIPFTNPTTITNMDELDLMILNCIVAKTHILSTMQCTSDSGNLSSEECETLAKILEF